MAINRTQLASPPRSFGRAGYFTGQAVSGDETRVSSCAQLPDAWFSISAGTIAAWFRRDGVGGDDTNSRDYVFCEPAFATASRIYVFFDHRTDTLTGMLGASTVVGTATVLPGLWTHVALSWSGTTGKLYLNGALVATTTFGGLTTFTGAWYLGTFNGGSNGQRLRGAIDDVRGYTRALSDAEVLSLYTSSDSTVNPVSSGLAVWYKLDEADPSTVLVDSSGNGRTGNWLSNNGSTGVPGVYTSGVPFPQRSLAP